MPILKKCVFLWLLCILSPVVYAQEEANETVEELVEEAIDTEPAQYFPVQRSVETDSNLVTSPIKTFQKDNLEKYLSDDDYHYGRKKQIDAESWLERFLRWLEHTLSDTFVPPGSGNVWRIIGWTLAGGLIVFAILKIIGADIRGFFARKPQSIELNFTEEETNIHVIDFDALIAEAVAKQQYKRAIRLSYLKSLKQLSDKEWIAWQPHKTNFEYVRELKNHDVAADFRQVTYLFEYIWYGDFQLTAATFSDTEKQFKELERRINRL